MLAMRSRLPSRLRSGPRQAGPRQAGPRQAGPRQAGPRQAGPRQAGFSLIELLVSLVIMAEILVGLLILFDSSSKLARAQTQVAELQQSLRVGQAEVVRFAKMAGIGGLPITRLNLPAGEPDGADPDYTDLLGAFPRSGYAVSVINNVPFVSIEQAVNPGATPGTDFVLPGSDVLILRGVFSTPLYYFDPPLDISDWLDVLPIDDQQVVIPDRQRVAGEDWEDYPQDVTALGERLAAAKAAMQPLALILRDTLNPNAYAIMELDVANTDAGELTPAAGLCNELASPAAAGADPAACIKLKLRLDITSEPSLSYAKLIAGTSLQRDQDPLNLNQEMTLELPAGVDPPGSTDAFRIGLPRNVGSIGLLEEYRFFVRVEHEVPGNPATRLTPVLARASFLPGTDIMIDRVDVADNVIDLQLAVGVDADDDGDVDEADDGNDEILFNHVDDTTSNVSPYAYRSPLDPPPAFAAVTWYDTTTETVRERPALTYSFLRINTVVQSRLPARDQVAPNLAMIEDFNRGVSFSIGGDTYELNSERLYQRRWLQTVVELRNLQ